MKRAAALATACVALALCSCGKGAALPEDAGYGPNPTIPKPDYGLIPPMALGHPLRWGPGQVPTPAPGLAVTKFAEGLNHPRWLYVLPNGDVLVAETDGPGETLGDVRAAMGFAPPA